MFKFSYDDRFEELYNEISNLREEKETLEECIEELKSTFDYYIEFLKTSKNMNDIKEVLEEFEKDIKESF